MLAEARRVPAQPEWRGSKADRLSDGVIATLGRMLADRHEINRTDMGILSDLFDLQNGHAGKSAASQNATQSAVVRFGASSRIIA